MDLFTNGQTAGETSVFMTIMAMALATILSLCITKVYQLTFNGPRYSQSFVHTIIIMSVVVSVVMNVVSSNAGVAFGLFAIFSLIRFRIAVTDAKDIAYIFFGLCVGMTCGLYQIGMAIALTFFSCFVIYLLHKFDYGKGKDTQILKATVPENLNHEDLFEDILDLYTEQHVLQEVETTNLGTMFQYTFAIRNKNTTKGQYLLDRIRERNANLKVSLSYLQALDQ
jgi:hypothetical protein